MSPRRKKFSTRYRHFKEQVKKSNRQVTFNSYIIILFLVLIAVAIFSVMNLFSVVALRNQTQALLSSGVLINHLGRNNDSVSSGGSSQVATSAVVITNPITTAPTTGITTTGGTVTTDNTGETIYSNVTAEPFFETHLIDTAKTNLRLDTKVNALTFTPAYDFSLARTCATDYCGQDKTDTSWLSANGQIYYQGRQLALPDELARRNISTVTFSKLSNKWLIGVVFSDGGQEVGYAYLSDGRKLTPLINNQTGPAIRTQYGRTGGVVSAGGSDKQFIVMYAGYEGIGYLYNNGRWQNISAYLGLRVMNGGFKPHILESGSGAAATWYIGSAATGQSHLLKLWQNGTEQIQGAVDLSEILTDGQSLCRLTGDKTVEFYSDAGAFTFRDKGFDNSHNYSYQSLNMSDYVGKWIKTVKLSSYVINAATGSYTLSIAPDNNNWQVAGNQEIDLSAAKSEKFYIRGDFKTGNRDYSPWFGGLKLISYTARDER